MVNIRKGFKLTPTDKDKRIEELEEKIGILLSCKNCPENKGGYICAKEYENKCLAQKIEYIKELQEENAELKKKNLDTQDAVTMQMYTNKANKEIADRQLTKAKVALRNVIDYLGQFCSDYPDCVIEAEQFLSEV